MQSIRRGPALLCLLAALFVVGVVAARYDRTTGLTGLLRFGDRFAEVEESIIDALKSREIDGLIDLTEEGLSAVRPGAEVKIASGPFADLVGIFQKRTGKERAMILLNVLGGMQRVEVPARDLRFLPGRVRAEAY